MIVYLPSYWQPHLFRRPEKDGEIVESKVIEGPWRRPKDGACGCKEYLKRLNTGYDGGMNAISEGQDV